MSITESSRRAVPSHTFPLRVLPETCLGQNKTAPKLLPGGVLLYHPGVIRYSFGCAFVSLFVFCLQDCDCEDYCAKCSAVFTLDVSWEKKSRGRPEHMQDQPVHVTSADLIGSVRRLLCFGNQRSGFVAAVLSLVVCRFRRLIYVGLRLPAWVIQYCSCC